MMFLFSSNSYAGLIGVEDHGTYFTDTQSGLDWLDLTATVGLSYEEVTQQLGTGELFEGWGVASANQFGTMWDNITGESTGMNGSDQVYGYPQNPSSPIFDQVIDLFGDTNDRFYQELFGQGYCEIEVCSTGGLRYSSGYLSDGLAPFLQYTGKIEADERFSSLSDTVSSKELRIKTDASWDNGTYLVRATTSVPEPASIALIAFGILGIFLCKKSNKFSVQNG